MSHFVVGFRGLFFFCKQKTAYEMRISDWSSDVCSSDLGDCEPFPDDKRAAALLKAAGKAAPKLDPTALAAALQDAWRAFHRGDLKAAFDAGSALGPVGASVAVKALGIHATYLVDAEAEKLKRFEQAAKLAEAAVKALPDEANSHYRHAFALGRYSQGLSIAKALKQGIAGKVRESLDEALALAPKHAEAHTALAVYHAEIIGKIGAMRSEEHTSELHSLLFPSTTRFRSQSSRTGRKTGRGCGQGAARRSQQPLSPRL